MAHVMCQARIHRVTNLPEDISVNTFHFSTGVQSAAGGAALLDLDVNAFYLVQAPAPATAALQTWLSNRTLLALGLEKRWYDMADAPPRNPILNTFATFTSVGTTSLPAEVALCGSFRAPYTSGFPNARRRGRIYFGPLAVAANTSSDGRPVLALSQSLAAASEKLKDDATTSGGAWVVFSRVDNTIYPIEQGWVDTAFDTQRRRGEAPISRVTWGP